MYFFIFLLFLSPSFYEISATPLQVQFHASVENLSPYSEQGSLFFLHALEKEWIFSKALTDSKILTDSLECWRNTEEGTSIQIDTRKLFDTLGQHHIDFLPPPFPKIVAVMINRNNEILRSLDVKELLEDLELAKGLEIVEPLWDNREMQIFDPIEIQGYLSTDWSYFLKKYDAEFLLFIQRDSVRLMWDVRIVDSFQKDLVRKRTTSMDELRDSIYRAILSRYKILKKPNYGTIKLVKKKDESFLQQYTFTEDNAEILYPKVQYMDQHNITIEFLTYWSSERLNFIEKQKNDFSF